MVQNSGSLVNMTQENALKWIVLLFGIFLICIFFYKIISFHVRNVYDYKELLEIGLSAIPIIISYCFYWDSKQTSKIIHESLARQIFAHDKNLISIRDVLSWQIKSGHKSMHQICLEILDSHKNFQTISQNHTKSIESIIQQSQLSHKQQEAIKKTTANTNKSYSDTNTQIRRLKKDLSTLQENNIKHIKIAIDTQNTLNAQVKKFFDDEVRTGDIYNSNVGQRFQDFVNRNAPDLKKFLEFKGYYNKNSLTKAGTKYLFILRERFKQGVEDILCK